MRDQLNQPQFKSGSLRNVSKVKSFSKHKSNKNQDYNTDFIKKGKIVDIVSQFQKEETTDGYSVMGDGEPKKFD